jgi:hypothetical protein
VRRKLIAIPLLVVLTLIGLVVVARGLGVSMRLEGAASAAAPAGVVEAEHTPSGSGGGKPTPPPAGQFAPGSEIRGSWTLQQINTQCGVPLEVLYRELGLSKSVSADLRLRDIKDGNGEFEVSVVRDMVTAYQAK